MTAVLLLVAVDGSAVLEPRAATFGVAAGLANGLALLSFYRAAAVGPISGAVPAGGADLWDVPDPVRRGVPGRRLCCCPDQPRCAARRYRGGAGDRAHVRAGPLADGAEGRALPGLLLLVGTATYGIATGSGPVSVVRVLATPNPVVTVGLAVVVLGERLAPRQQAGVATALLGVVLLASG